MSDVNELIEKYQYKGRGIFEPSIKIDYFIIEIIKGKGDLTRKDLADLTKIPRTTIYDTIEKLIFNGKIEKYSILDRKKGRPKIYYRIIE